MEKPKPEQVQRLSIFLLLTSQSPDVLALLHPLQSRDTVPSSEAAACLSIRAAVKGQERSSIPQWQRSEYSAY